jgi:ComF family protein
VLLCEDCRAAVQPLDPESLQLNQLNVLVCAGVFTGPLRQAIHHFKYDSDKPLAAPLADLLVDALGESQRFADLCTEPPALAPVPLHATRIRSRGYNQSELLARNLAEKFGWPLEQRLVRVKRTLSQVGLSVEQRGENVAGAFEWRGGEVPSFVVLVDDVCTTGATLSECAATLRAKGATKVCAVTVAKATGDTQL